MMVNTKTPHDLEEARKVRNEYRLEQIRRRLASRAELANPIVDPAWIRDVEDGTLDGPRILDGDLPLTVPQWETMPEDGESHILTLQWAAGANPGESEYVTVGTETVTAPIPDGTFPVAMTVPNARLRPDGLYQLRYKVLAENGEESISTPLPLICDTTPPWRHAEPTALILPTAELTEAYLSANPGDLVGTLPPYADYQPGDKVAFWWMTTPLPSDPDQLPPPLGFIDVDSGRQVSFPRSLLEASADKDYYAFYLLYDKAGNRSPLSAYTRVDVALGVLPASLQNPVVPLAADGLLDLGDARAGITVEIPVFDHHKPADRIAVTWGDTALPTLEIGALPRFPISITVPLPVLRDTYDRAAGGEQPTHVSYHVLRGHLPSEVKAITELVDFSTIGPDPQPDPDPDWPDPVNPALTPAEIRGTGAAPELNKLLRSDASLPANLTFDLYTPLEAGEVVDFFWGTTEVVDAVYIIQDTDTPPGTITVSIPWLVIEAVGNNPQLPVHYRIHAPGSDNYQRSPDTLVDVNAIVVSPEQPVFQGLSENGWLNCRSLFENPAAPVAGKEPGVRVAVPDLSRYRKVGDKVTLVWVALQRASGEVIEGTEKREEITLDNGDYPVTGFTWYVQPYETFLLPTYNPPQTSALGRAYYHYTDEQGEDIVSKYEEAKVGMFDAAGSCPLPEAD